MAIYHVTFTLTKSNGEGGTLYFIIKCYFIRSLVGWVTTEKPSLLEHLRGADLLGSKVESISHEEFEEAFLD